jgi:hypothetical protein
MKKIGWFSRLFNRTALFRNDPAHRRGHWIAILLRDDAASLSRRIHARRSAAAPETQMTAPNIYFRAQA